MQAGTLFTIVDAFGDELLGMRFGVEQAYEVAARYIERERTSHANGPLPRERTSTANGPPDVQRNL